MIYEVLLRFFLTRSTLFQDRKPVSANLFSFWMYGLKIHKKKAMESLDLPPKSTMNNNMKVRKGLRVWDFRYNFFVEKNPLEGQEQPRWLSKTMQNDEKQEIDEKGDYKYIVEYC